MPCFCTHWVSVKHFRLDYDKAYRTRSEANNSAKYMTCDLLRDRGSKLCVASKYVHRKTYDPGAVATCEPCKLPRYSYICAR